jgi:hypothetical protein
MSVDVAAIREMQDDDLPHLLRHWEETGWGVLPADLWRARHRTGPRGPSHVAVAVDEAGSVLGHVTVMRTLLNVRGSGVPAARIHGAVFSADYRRRHTPVALPDHPLLHMLLSLVDPLVRDGVAVLYVVPDKRLMPLVRHLPEVAQTDFPLWSRTLGPAPALPACHEVVPEVAPGAIDALWERCRGDLVCTARDARTLAWKALFAPLRVEGIRRDGELVAIVASRPHGDRQWLLEDLLAVDHRARVAAIASVVRAAVVESAAREIRKVGALAAPILEPALTEVGFSPDDFTFHLLVHRMDDQPVEDLDPRGWYLTPND